jgi:hypothetical protein
VQDVRKTFQYQLAVVFFQVVLFQLYHQQLIPCTLVHGKMPFLVSNAEMPLEVQFLVQLEHGHGAVMLAEELFQ